MKKTYLLRKTHGGAAAAQQHYLFRSTYLYLMAHSYLFRIPYSLLAYLYALINLMKEHTNLFNRQIEVLFFVIDKSSFDFAEHLMI